MPGRCSWCNVFALLCCNLCQSAGVYIMGTPEEFPSRYCISTRGLTSAIMSSRPDAINALDVQSRVPDASKLNFMLQVNASNILRSEDLRSLKMEVARIKEHFRNVSTFNEYGANPIDFGVSAGRTEDYDFRLTSMASLYNIFSLNSTAVGRLYWAIKVSFHKYATVHNFDLSRRYFIHGWFNCFQGGSNIDTHSHGYDSISGNLAIHVPPGSFTHYIKSSLSSTWQPYQRAAAKCRKGNKCACPLRWPFADRPQYQEDFDGEDLLHPNREGELMFFHSTTQHRSSTVTEEMQHHLNSYKDTLTCRMTAAFDISPHPDLAHHTIPLYDPFDPWWEKDPKASHVADVNADMESIFNFAKVLPTFEWELFPDSDRFWAHWEKCQDHIRDWCAFLAERFHAPQQNVEL